MVVNDNDSVLDPHTIKWKRLNKKNFPYQLNSGKVTTTRWESSNFNFRNKYSVYLHDTNVRWRFGNSYRAISHGCIRVKEWDKLANYLVRNDTLRLNSAGFNKGIYSQG